MSKPKFLIVLTSQDMIPTNRATTGWYLVPLPHLPYSPSILYPAQTTNPKLTLIIKRKSELAHPYTILSPHLSLTISSPQGGEAPLDPSSAVKQILENDPVVREFLEQNRGLWTRTAPLREVVSGVTEGEFVGVLFVGGHGRAFPPVYPRAGLL